jgi:hypothetical protein
MFRGFFPNRDGPSGIGGADPGSAGPIRDWRGRSGIVRPARRALNCLPHVDALVCRRETFNFADRLFGAKSGLSDDTSGLTDLSANLLDRGRQLFGGAGASAGIRCTLVMDCAVSRIADALPVIARITSPIAPRNASTELSICSARCSRALESSRTCELRLRLRAIAPWKTRIARARRGMLSHHSIRRELLWLPPGAAATMLRNLWPSVDRRA